MSLAPFSLDAVLALSPDEASAKAARGLVAPGKWPMLGTSAVAVWGECQGSGSKPYQTQVDVSGAGPTFKCSCPSRKFPCKHGLALLLMQVQDASRFTAPEPAWVAQWLASRQERADKKDAKAAAPAAPAAPVDPALAVQRQGKRFERMAAGAQELGLWLDDLARRGLASLSADSQSGAASMAARMVDAQAPGLGQRLTASLALVGQGQDWPAQVLERLGNLQLLVDACVQRERLPAALQADVRQALGWPFERDEVLATGLQITDRWRVTAHVLVEREARLTERRVWLLGAQSRQRALLLDFSYAGKAFEQGWMLGQSLAGTLAFYPGADPLRAVLAAVAAQAADGPEIPEVPEIPEASDAATEWNMLADRMAANPWAERWPLMLGQAVVQRVSDAWSLRTGDQVLPLHLNEHNGWRLMAYAAGQPMTLWGEWDGRRLQPLSAWVGGAVTPAWRSATLMEGAP